jgi:hypothetical protein
MEYKVLAFHPSFDVLEPSLNKWASEGWRVVCGWSNPANGHITIVIEKRDS